jgi:hypothetical protein
MRSHPRSQFSERLPKEGITRKGRKRYCFQKTDMIVK